MEQFSTELADLLVDAETVGLQVKIITKEPSMVDTVALLESMERYSVDDDLTTDDTGDMIGAQKEVPVNDGERTVAVFIKTKSLQRISPLQANSDTLFRLFGVNFTLFQCCRSLFQ